ncbi:MAG: TolC family protein [Candidatus Aminicenantes bacterium]
MKKGKLLSATVLILWGALLAFCQEDPLQKVTLPEIVEQAVERNPRIRAAYQEWQAALEKIPQAESLPDPMLGYSHFGQSVETRLGPQRNKISLSQKIPFFGKLSLRGKIAQQGASMLQERYNRVKDEVILKAKEFYFSLYWFDKVLAISQQEKEVLERLSHIAQKKYETGTANQQDVLKAQLEISKVKDKILNLNQGRRAVAASLNSLLDRPPHSLVGKVREPQLPEFKIKIDRLYQIAEEKKPELKEVRHLIAQSEESLKLAKKNYYPDFTFMVDYIDIGGGTTSMAEDGRNAWMGSVGINIPLWRKKLQASQAEAELKLEASREKYNQVKNMTLSEVNELYHEVKTAAEQIDLYQYSLLPQAEQSFKASEVGYLAGKVDFLNLLDSERMVLLIKTGYYKTVSDYGKSLARLERSVGEKIEHME